MPDAVIVSLIRQYDFIRNLIGKSQCEKQQIFSLTLLKSKTLRRDGDLVSRLILVYDEWRKIAVLLNRDGDDVSSLSSFSFPVVEVASWLR